jgi:D-serine deaminase-like pyridoxal phosphate-dependent protein
MEAIERGPDVRHEPVIGLAVDELPTPALVLDVDAATRNAATMGSHVRALPAKLRPHIKVHKCAELARIQLEHGAIGVTTATVAEAEAMVASGVPDVLIANEVVGHASIDRLARAARGAIVTVAVDDLGNLAELGLRARAAGTELGVVVEFDVGMGRGGARSDDEALALGRAAVDIEGVRLRGVLGYEGHVASEPDPATRITGTREAIGRLVDLAGRFASEGLPIDIVSAGATGTYDVTGAIPRVTEVQAGSYILMDRFHEPLVTGFEFAVTVLATAISVHGDLVVFDAGRKSIGSEFGPPAAPGERGRFDFIHEEHLGYRFEGGAPFRVGDRVALVPTYAPTTVNLFGAFNVVRAGLVVDVWPVLARHGEA